MGPAASLSLSAGVAAGNLIFLAISVLTLRSHQVMLSVLTMTKVDFILDKVKEIKYRLTERREKSLAG